MAQQYFPTGTVMMGSSISDNSVKKLFDRIDVLENKVKELQAEVTQLRYRVEE